MIGLQSSSATRRQSEGVSWRSRSIHRGLTLLDPTLRACMRTNDIFTATYSPGSDPLGPLGLVYYNYRHYEPMTGRWMSRDPIEEYGGRNLAVFAGNRGGDRTDYLGLSWWDYILVLGTIKSAIDNYLGHIQGESVVDYPFVSPYDCKCNEESAEAECIMAIEKQTFEYISDASLQLVGGAVVDVVVAVLGCKANVYVGTFLTLNAVIDVYIKSEIYSKIMAGSNSAMKNNCDCSQYVK